VVGKIYGFNFSRSSVSCFGISVLHSRSKRNRWIHHGNSKDPGDYLHYNCGRNIPVWPILNLFFRVQRLLIIRTYKKQEDFSEVLGNWKTLLFLFS